MWQEYVVNSLLGGVDTLIPPYAIDTLIKSIKLNRLGSIPIMTGK